MKLCLWCEQEIIRTSKRISAADWAAKKLHRQCVTSWRHHKCAKKDVTQPAERTCSCGKALVRRTDEKWQAWVKRGSCNKSCAASTKHRTRKPPEVVVLEAQMAVGVRQYVPGSVEFNRIAALYA